MNKRFLSALLCLVFLLCLALPVYAEEAEISEESAPADLTISTVEEFLKFAENCRLDSYSQDLVVSLEADIDLSGTVFTGVPIFSGTFRGNGHRISGLAIDHDGSEQGLFRRLTVSALVEDLQVRGNVTPGGSQSNVGGITGRNEGTIRGCSFSGSVSGGDIVGGIAGLNTVTGVIEDCQVSGVIHGSHFVGGIAGENDGVIRRCGNESAINTTAQQNEVDISDITLDSLTSSEAVNTTTDIGGIAGISGGVIRECENRGSVGYQKMGYNIGGIAGTQSGYIVDCVNYADIQGRKEVGGIAGQMEPVFLVEYSEDTLQILQGQLSTLSGLVNKASGNAQANASQLTSKISLLQDQIQTARDAVDTLTPDLEDPQIPDLDTYLSALNTLTTSLNAMPGTLNSIASASQNTVSTLSRDLIAISNQVSVMSQTINGASENLGGTIADVSDQDTDETLTGKVARCVNYGSILADLNVGGIAGAMATENDLDVLEDWQQIGENSLNFSGEARAVIRDCANLGTVTGAKSNAGGIVGWQSMGLVSGCENTGLLDAESADHVGGISGLSAGFIRSSSAKCEISGDTCVGGIAGSASTVTDCRSMVLIRGGRERLGAIIGLAEETDGESPISGNFYLCVAEDIGAIDGISYDGQAQPLSLEDFMALEDLPDLFHTVTVRFVYEDGTQETISLVPGESLDQSRIPAVPDKSGYVGEWAGLADVDLTSVVFDMTFEPLYTIHCTTIQSQQTRDNGLPVLLLQGTFTDDSPIEMTVSDAAPVLSGGETLAESWLVRIPEGDHASTAHLLLPAAMDTGHFRLMVRSEGSQWEEREYTVDESYLVFSMSCCDTNIAIIQTEAQDNTSLVVLAAGILAIAAAGGVACAVIKRKKGKKKPAEAPQKTEA